jgi:hypothetical protein
MSRRRNNDAMAWSGVPHSRIRHDVTDSPAWRVLGFSAKALYTDLRAKLRSTNNGNINATLSEMKHRGWTSSSTLANALRQLEHMGFIAKTRQGGIAAMSKQCNLYRFTDLEVFEFPKQGIAAMKATFDWQRFDSLKTSQAHMRRLSEKSKVRNPKLTDSESEAMSSPIGSESEQEDCSQLRKSNKANCAENRATAGGLAH